MTTLNLQFGIQLLSQEISEAEIASFRTMLAAKPLPGIFADYRDRLNKAIAAGQQSMGDVRQRHHARITDLERRIAHKRSEARGQHEQAASYEREAQSFKALQARSAAKDAETVAANLEGELNQVLNQQAGEMNRNGGSSAVEVDRVISEMRRFEFFLMWETQNTTGPIYQSSAPYLPQMARL